MIKEKIRDEVAYRQAREQYWAQEPQALKVVGARYPRREELHER